MFLEHLDEFFDMFRSCMVAEPFGRKCQPRHHIGASRDHALDRSLVRLDGDTTAGIGDHRHVPSVPKSMYNRHRDADLGVKASNDQLLAPRCFYDVDDIFVLPCIQRRAINHFLVRAARTYYVRRYGEREDIAAAMALLVNPAAKFITGTVLNVDGGITA